MALVILGIHGAADRLDDVIGSLLVNTEMLSWFGHDSLMDVSIAVAIAIELVVVGWAIWTRLRSTGTAIAAPQDWWSRRSIQAGVAAFAWLPLSLAGCWVVAIAIEDQLAGLLPSLAIYIGLVVAVLTAWRLGLTGWVRIVRHTPFPRRPWEGWPFALPVVLVATIALRYGLPIWGWL